MQARDARLKACSVTVSNNFQCAQTHSCMRTEDRLACIKLAEVTNRRRRYNACICAMLFVQLDFKPYKL